VLTPPKYGHSRGDLDQRAEPNFSMLSWNNKAATNIIGMIAGVVNQKPDKVWTSASLLAALNHAGGDFSYGENGVFPQEDSQAKRKKKGYKPALSSGKKRPAPTRYTPTRNY
jgi:hypothetical protein